MQSSHMPQVMGELDMFPEHHSGPGEILEDFTEQMTFELVWKSDCCAFQVDEDVKAEEESINPCSLRAHSRLTLLLWSEMFFLIKKSCFASIKKTILVILVVIHALRYD